MKKVSAVSVALLVLSLLLCVGVATVLHPCAHDDGSISTCHWAGQRLIGLGCVLTLLALGLFFIPRAKARCSLAVVIALAAFLALLTPGTLMPLCMMDTMRCNSIMKPSAMILSAAIFVMALLKAVKESTHR